MNQELENYIKQEKSVGIKDDAIKQKLRDGGWKDEMFNECFVSNTITQQKPYLSEYTQEAAKHNKLIFGIIASIVVLGAGAYFAFAQGLFNFSDTKEVKTKENIQEEIVVVGKEEIVEEENNDGWKVYNNNFGIAFDYPAEFIRGDNSKWLGELFKSETGYFWFKVDENENLNTLQEIKDDYYLNDTYGYQYEDSFIKVNGLDIYKQGRYDLGVIENYYFLNNNKLISVNFEFNFSDESQILQNKYKNLISDIIKTLKFLDEIIVDTSDWIEHNDSINRISFKYPPGYQAKNKLESTTIYTPGDLAKTDGTEIFPLASINTVENYGAEIKGEKFNSLEEIKDSFKSLKERCDSPEFCDVTYIKDIQIDGMSGLKVGRNWVMEDIITVISTTNNDFIVIYSYSDSPNIFDEFINTFKFLDDNKAYIKEDNIYYYNSVEESTILIAESIKYDVGDSKFYENKLYEEATLSPNGEFILLEGTGFEWFIIEIYDISSKTTYTVNENGYIIWLNDNRIKVEGGCGMGTSCGIFESINSEEPWILEKISD